MRDARHIICSAAERVHLHGEACRVLQGTVKVFEGAWVAEKIVIGICADEARWPAHLNFAPFNTTTIPLVLDLAHFPIIHTTRRLLRELRDTDASPLFTLRSDPRAMRFVPSL